MSALLELADRCEKAVGPDREIDCLIFEWLNSAYTPAKRGMYYGEPTGVYFEYVGDGEKDEVAHAGIYTASLDAAMTLVPEGWDWLREAHNEMRVYPTALYGRLDYAGQDRLGANELPALALTAAALRARAAPVDGRRQAETALAGSGRSPTSAVTAKPAGAPSPSPSNPPQEESPT